MIDFNATYYLLLIFPVGILTFICLGSIWLFPRMKTRWFWLPFIASFAASIYLTYLFVINSRGGDSFQLLFFIPFMITLGLITSLIIGLLFSAYQRRRDSIELKKTTGLKAILLLTLGSFGLLWTIASTYFYISFFSIEKELSSRIDQSRLEELWGSYTLQHSERLGERFIHYTAPDSIVSDVVMTSYQKGWFDYRYKDRNIERINDFTRANLVGFALKNNDKAALKTFIGTHSNPCAWASSLNSQINFNDIRNAELTIAQAKQYWCETYANSTVDAAHSSEGMANDSDKQNTHQNGTAFSAETLTSYLQKLRHSYNPISYYNNFRFSNSEMVSLQTLQTMSGMPMFVSGPHTTEKGFDQSNEKQFGHYNPKFVDWFFNDLFMSDSSGLKLHINQQLYDDKLRDLSRIYYLSYIKLERSGVLKAWQADYAGKLARGESVAGYYFQFEPILSEYDIESYSAAHATTFWIRRAIDGTDKNFFNGLQKVLAHYDPTVLHYAKSWQDTNTIIRPQNKIFFAYVKSRTDNRITLNFKAPIGILKNLAAAFASNQAGEPVWLYHQQLGLIKATWLSYKEDLQAESEPSIEVTLESPLIQFRKFPRDVTYIALLNTSVVAQNWLYAPMTLTEIDSYHKIIQGLEEQGFYIFDKGSILNKVSVQGGPSYLLVRYTLPMEQEPGGPEPQVPFYRIYIFKDGKWQLSSEGQARMVMPYMVFDTQSAKSVTGFVPYAHQGSQLGGLLRVD